MSTALYDQVIFGPVHSRRLGLSLGVNLLSPTSKHCNFDCIYCECGWNASHPHGSFNAAEVVFQKLEEKLIQMAVESRLPDYITFAGNGEPTMHPQFKTVIDQVIEIRNRIAPSAKIAVLSNATMIHLDAVREALLKVDRNILKLDSAIENTARTINRANHSRTTAQIIDLMQRFEGRLVVQTMLIRGDFQGVHYDNTTQVEIQALMEAYQAIAPSEIMLYSIDRDTPATGIIKIEHDEMENIAKIMRQEGLNVTVN
ncbi:MAG: radical SAM protein [Mucinivorans sp.]